MHELRIGVSYDFRNPVNSGVSDAHLYAEILEQVKWLDQIGADMVWFTEHHFVEDGYLPTALTPSRSAKKIWRAFMEQTRRCRWMHLCWVLKAMYRLCAMARGHSLGLAMKNFDF